MLEELKGELDLSRLHFTGLLPYGELVQLFRRSDLHCYFTRPYVVSWGVFQAAACGARLLVNKFPGLDEVFAEVPELPFVDLDHDDSVINAVLSALQKNFNDHHRQSLLAAGKGLSSAIETWLKLL